MNIRSNVRGRALLWDGTNFEEILEFFQLWDWVKNYLGRSTDEHPALLEAYIAHAKEIGSDDRPMPCYPEVRDAGSCVCALEDPNDYLIEINNHFYVLNQRDFNNFFEEIPQEDEVI